jgi:hypothetical protein
MNCQWTVLKTVKESETATVYSVRLALSYSGLCDQELTQVVPKSNSRKEKP